jgi:hypothetical protein
MSLIVTQQVIDEVHERLQYDDCFDCEYLKDVPLTAAGLLAMVNHLGPLYGREATLVVLAWSAAEALMRESTSIFCDRNWNLNLAKDRRELKALQIFKSRYRKPLFEAGYVGDLIELVPVVASIQATSSYAILTVAPGPLQIENEKGVPHNSVLAFWKVP